MILAVDTETTGLLLPCCVPIENQPRIIEFAALLFDGSTGDIKATAADYVNPVVSIPRNITELTGITNADVAQAEEWGYHVENLKALVPEADFIIAHNAAFDREIIRLNCERYEVPNPFNSKDWVCTMQESQWVRGKGSKMREIYHDILGANLEQTHRAEDDVRALIRFAVELNKMGSLRNV